MYCVFAHMDLHPEFPKETVYPEDEEPVPYSDNKSEQDRLRSVILGLKPLRRAFGLGDVDVIFFGPNISAEGMERALSQLDPDQRHRPQIIDLDQGAVFDKLLKLTQNKKLLFWRPQGWMTKHDCLNDPGEAYMINSKKFLVTSGIRTPASEIVSLRGTDITDRSSIFSARPLPFVVKLCRAGCGFGTYIVTNESRREEMLAAMDKYKARGVDEVLISDYIDLVQDLSVHFLIGAPTSEHNRSNPLILGVTVQTLTKEGKWVGGHIDYSAQAALQDLVWETVRDTTQKLPETFMGWAGIDIVVDNNGEQYVVDLNARFTGSMPICFMSGHFWKERALPLAQFAAFEYRGAPDDVYDVLGPFIRTGVAVVTATAAIEGDLNMADIIWGGENHQSLAYIGDCIRRRLART
ncbi:hypothetical protein DL767_001829 [Monosporascus sp. MG133]|nr:hypothetical protein DL767_001829 [Monosporascus sp. MG133]